MEIPKLFLRKNSFKVFFIAFFISAFLVSLWSNSAFAENESAIVSVKITKFDQTIWEGNVDVGTIDHPTALGALLEASKAGGFPVEVVSSTYGSYVSSIAGIAASGWDGWGYMVNGDSPYVGMGDYIISAGDEIIVYYGWPWKLTADKTNVMVGETVVFTAYHYDVLARKWQVAPNTSVKIGEDELATNENGKVAKIFNKAGTYEAYLTSWGYANSPSVTVVVSEAPPPAYPIAQDELKEAAQKALSYLRNSQQENGSIENAGVSGWAAIAFGAAGIYSQEVKSGSMSLADYLKGIKLESASDYARQILVALAMGEDPRSFGEINLVEKLYSFYQDGQFGDTAFLNDDIFAILALVAASESPFDYRINNALDFVLSNQAEDGGFSWAVGGLSGDVDDTSATIQMLSLTSSLRFDLQIDNVLTEAKTFLKNSQNADGGFPFMMGASWGSDSNPSSTAWAIQAILSLGEEPSDWISTSGLSPYHYLIEAQQESGAYGFMPGVEDNFTTAQVIPALLGKSWPIILSTANLPPSTDRDKEEVSSPQDLSRVEEGHLQPIYSKFAEDSQALPKTDKDTESKEGFKKEKEKSKSKKGDRSSKKEKEKKFNPPVSVTERDKSFLLFVFISSILAICGLVILMIVKVRK